MRTINALWIRNLKSFARDRARLIISLIIPFFFTYVFNAIFKDDSIENPVTYLLAGIIITTVFDSALTVATSTIDDTVSGFMKEVLVSPTKRFHVATGQLLSAATVSTLQAILIFIVGLFIGFEIINWYDPLLIIGTMVVVGLAFAGFGLFLATAIKNSQTFKMVQMAITMPFTFLSGAYLPLSLLPKPLQIVSYFNPMTYVTALFRAVALGKLNLSNEELVQQGLAIDINGFIVTPLFSLIFIVGFGLIFLLLATRSFVKTDFSKMGKGNKKVDWV